MLIACTDKHVLGWHIARSEHTSAWQALFSRIAPPDVVVCDGGQGIHKAVKREWSRTRIQRCVFHVFCSVKQKTTTRPRTNAGVELYGLAKALLRVNTLQQASQWLTSLTQWNARWQLMLSERTRYPDGGVDFTHKRLVQAKDTLPVLGRCLPSLTQSCSVRGKDRYRLPRTRSRAGLTPNCVRCCAGTEECV